jgi:Holliday junction resolvase RusA-like endonuclease
MKHTLTIPNWKPVSVNRLVGRHWGQVHKLKAADAKMVAAYALQARLPAATGRRRVKVLIECLPGQLLDGDNCLKSLLDALVKCRALVDDSAEYLDLVRVEVVAAARPGTTITLEDVEYGEE